MTRMNVIVALAAWSLYAAGAETNLCCDVFEFGAVRRLMSAPAEFSDSAVKNALSAQGVSWPEGASVCRMLSYDDHVGNIAIVNTRENLARCHALVAPKRLSKLIEVRYDVYAIAPEAVESLRHAGVVGRDLVQASCRQGNARLVNSAQAFAEPGREASVRNCKEITYLTEEQLAVAMNQNATGAIISPSGFKTREVGTILEFNAEYCEDVSRIRLWIRPRWVTVRRGESAEAKARTETTGDQVAYKQPEFCESSLESEFVMSPGESILVAGGQCPEDEKLILYHLITVNMTEVGGRPEK